MCLFGRLLTYLYFIGGRISSVTSRKGTTHEISAPLHIGATIWADLERIYNENVSESSNSTGGPLFSPQFKRTFENQKNQILEHVKEIFIDGKHYFEAEDGVFHLYRGTNRNESLHKRLNHMWPEKCSQELGKCLLNSFIFSWNARRKPVLFNLLDDVDTSSPAGEASEGSRPPHESESAPGTHHSVVLATVETATQDTSSAVSNVHVLDDHIPKSMACVRLSNIDYLRVLGALEPQSFINITGMYVHLVPLLMTHY